MIADEGLFPKASINVDKYSDELFFFPHSIIIICVSFETKRLTFLIIKSSSDSYSSFNLQHWQIHK